MASTPKKIKKKMTDLSESVGRSVGKRLSGLVSSNSCRYGFANEQSQSHVYQNG